MSGRLRVDWTACDGHGQCVELLPELLDADAWGYPLVRDPDVPHRLTRHAERAVALCPRMALSLRDQPTPPTTPH